VRRFLGKFLLCPTHPQKPPIPATLHANLRINKILYNPRRYEEAEPEVEVFGQALVYRFIETYLLAMPCVMLTAWLENRLVPN